MLCRQILVAPADATRTAWKFPDSFFQDGREKDRRLRRDRKESGMAMDAFFLWFIGVWLSDSQPSFNEPDLEHAAIKATHRLSD